MHKRLRKVGFVLLCGMAPVVFAEDSPNDDNNYKGDRVTFPIRIHAKIGDATSLTCIPARTPLRGLGGDAAGATTVKFKLSSYGIHKDCDATPKEIPSDEIVHVEKADLNNSAPTRIGVTYGALVVPYKYHLSGSKDFKGDTSVGPYLGYRFDKNLLGVGLKAITFLGISAISVTETSNGQTTDHELAGISYGVGLISEIKSEFQMGLIIGADRVGKSDSQSFPDNGKAWVAIALGYSFAK